VAELVQQYLDQIREEHASVTEGTRASYIPELAGVDPSGFGLSLSSSDGYVYESGDTAIEFTVQSISKLFTYALAIDQLGEAAVDAKIGVEPVGRGPQRDQRRPHDQDPKEPDDQRCRVPCRASSGSVSTRRRWTPRATACAEYGCAAAYLRTSACTFSPSAGESRSTIRAIYEPSDNVRVYEIHGDLLFAGAEQVIRTVSREADEFDAAVLDVSRLDNINDPARELLASMRPRCARRSRRDSSSTRTVR
jgi:hypothetical protein